MVELAWKHFSPGFMPLLTELDDFEFVSSHKHVARASIFAKNIYRHSWVMRRLDRLSNAAD
jgi:hypothetical protein